MPDEDILEYVVPPDVLHFEPRYILGFTATELVVAGGMAIPALYILGPVAGLIAGVVTLMAVHRLESLGNRSVLTYAFQRVLHNARRREVRIARLLPEGQRKIEILTWDMRPVFGVQGSDESLGRKRDE